MQQGQDFFSYYFPLESNVGYILALGPELSETRQLGKNGYLRALQLLLHSFTVSFGDVLANIY